MSTPKLATSRQLVKTGHDVRLGQLLSSLFLAEALAPSKWIYIVSPWTRNIDVLDNRSGSLHWLDEDWPMSHVRLLDWVKTVIRGGACVQFVDTESDQEAASVFKEEVALLRRELDTEAPGRLREIKMTGSLQATGGNHLKGIFSERFALTGSMNISTPGLTMHTEHIAVHLPADDGYKQLIPQIHQLWGPLGD